MKRFKLGFIGLGNMGSALALAACQGAGPENVAVMNRSPEKARRFSEEQRCAFLETAEAVARESEFVVLGVKPQQLRALVQQIAPALDEETVLVTMAAGLTIKSVAEAAGGACPVLRILPNTPCALGQGMVLVSRGEDEAEKAAEFERLLAAAWRFEEIPETLMDAGCAASGCSPAYAYLFIDAIARGAAEAGVPYEQALSMAAQAVLGAAAMVLRSGKDPDTLCENVCSPGGSTIEGVRLLREEGLPDLVRRATLASWRRNVELGQ